MTRPASIVDIDRQIAEARRIRHRLRFPSWDHTAIQLIVLKHRLSPWMAASKRGKRLPNGVVLPDMDTLLIGILAHPDADWSHVQGLEVLPPALQQQERQKRLDRWKQQIKDDNLIWTDPEVQRIAGIGEDLGTFLSIYLRGERERADLLFGLDTFNNPHATAYNRAKLENVRSAFEAWVLDQRIKNWHPLERLSKELCGLNAADRTYLFSRYGAGQLFARRAVSISSVAAAQLLAACMLAAEYMDDAIRTYVTDEEFVDDLLKLFELRKPRFRAREAMHKNSSP